MKKLSKVLAVAMAAFMVTSSLSGCTQKPAADNTTKSETSSDTSSNAADTSTGTETDAGGFNETGMPIVNEPVTISVLTMRWGDMGDSFAKNQWLVDLEARSNVKVEWIVKSSNDWGEQKSILFAGGDLPDVFFGNQTIKDGDIMGNLDYFMPLDEVIDKYMPNYKKAIETLPVLKEVSTFPDGKIYSFAKNLPSRPMTCNQPIINKVWLDNLGLEVPDTYEDLAKVLVAFKENDANGNGNPNDEIPVSFSGDIHNDMFNPFGISDINATSMIMQNGQPVYYPTSENYKSAIKWLRDLYAAGAIDAESFTQDNSMLTGKFVNADAPLVGFSMQWVPDAVFGKWSDQYIAIPPLKGPDGNRYAGGDKNGVFSIMRNEAEITTFCKSPEVVARWIDEFYDSEASIQNFWGAIGTVISKNSDGTYTLNNPPEGTSADAWYWDQSLRDFGPKFVEPGFSDKILLSKESGDGLKLEISKMADAYVMDQYPKVIFTEEENNELATLSTDIGSYVLQTRAKWITNGGIDEEWDAYVSKLKAMDVDKLIQIYMDAFNRTK